MSVSNIGDGIFQDLMNFRSEDIWGSATGKVTKVDSVGVEKKIKPSERLLMDIEKSGYDLSQMRTVLSTKGNQLIISCAGSGKTTSLIFKIMYDLKTGWSTRVEDFHGSKIRVPDKIYVGTFLSTGAEELKWSLKIQQNKLHCADMSDSIQFSTLHAEFKRALTALGISTKIISAKDNTQLLKNVLKPYQLLNQKGKPLNSEDISNLESALARTRNILDDTRYESKTYEEFGITAKLIDNILFEWALERKNAGKCDFDDLQEMLYSECYKKNNQEIINFLSNRYNFMYIDEFQDTSQIQYALIKVYAIGCKQIVAIGDDDQTIYSWRGSDNKIITEKFVEDFSPTINKLSINFRCPWNILKAIVPSIKNNGTRFEKDLQSHAEGGKVRLAPMNSYTGMISLLSDCIYNDVKQGRSVAILCRTNSDGLMPALILDKLNQITFSISGEGMTLNSYIGRTVLSIVKLFTERTTNSVKNALEMLTWERYEVANLLKACKSNKMSIWQIDKKDLAYSCPSIAQTLLMWRDYREKFGDVQALKKVLGYYRCYVFDKDNQFNLVTRSVISSVEALLDYFEYDYVEDFLYELEEINERLLGRKGKKNVKVQIATVHEFKGKEADSVYIWNDSEDVFPQKNAIETLEEIEEERRVHYIACTRAKQYSTIIYLRSKKGMFLDEMDLDGVDTLEASGVVMGMLQTKSEEEKNFNDFSKKSSEEGDNVEETIEKDTQVYLEGLVPYVSLDENEFWGKDYEDAF